MPTLYYAANTIGQPIEVGPGTRITLSGGGYVEYTTQPLSIVRSAPSQVTWTTWPSGSTGTYDTVQRIVFRVQATSAATLAYEEGFNSRPVVDTQVWQETEAVYDPATGALLGKDGLPIYTLDQRAADTTILYVATTGSDANPGTSYQPFATIQAAFNAMQLRGAAPNGNYVIQLAAGSYAGATYPSNVWGLNRITIKGPSVGGHPNVPTALIDGSVGGANGLVFNARDNVYIKDVKIQNFSNHGLVAQDGCDIYTDNVHVAGCAAYGMNFAGSRVRVAGGLISSCAIGIVCIGGTGFTLGYTAANLSNGTQITNCTQSGVLVQENSTGHADYVTVDGCAVGIDIIANSRVHAVGATIKNAATVGIQCRMNSHWYDNGTSANFSGNARNTLYASFSGEIGTQSVLPARLQALLNTNQATLTGTTTETELRNTGAIFPANAFKSAGQSFEIIVRGQFSGTGGDKTLRLRLANVAGAQIAGAISFPNSTNYFEFKSSFRALGANSQDYMAALIDTSTRTSGGRIGFDTSVATTVSITGQLTSAADSIRVDSVEVLVQY